MELVVDNTEKVEVKELVEVGKFFDIANDNHKEQYGFSQGQRVLVVGEGIFPCSPDDPYLRRVYFAVVKFENGTMDMNQKPIVIAAESLASISQEEQETFQAMLKAFEDNFQASEE